MADVVNQISTLSIKLTMYRDSDESTKTRTFSVRDPAVSESESDTFRQSLQNLQNFLLGDGKTLIQPTGWRDTDTTEEEYVTTAIEFTTEEGVGTKWDTRLTHNMSSETTSVAWADLSTNASTPEYITISGVDLNLVPPQITTTISNDQVAILVGCAIYEETPGTMVLYVCKSDSSTTGVTGTITVTIPQTGVYQEDTLTIEVT